MERKVCFITGSGSGNGRGMALRMAELGYDIALHHSGRDPEMAEKTRALIAEKGVRCEVFEQDLFEPNAARALFDKFRAKFDRLDVFVNNSGRTLGGRLLEMNEETFDYVDRVNWKAAYFCVQQAGLFMKEKKIRGSIVIISSNHHRVNFGWASAYASMKEALVRYTQYAALEFSPYGIRVNCIAPGNIDPEYEKKKNFRDYVKQVSETIPLHRFVTSTELADITEFLSSPAAASITGNTLDVDGGMFLLNY
ncbi:MAG: SDR family oxidoreductase, partial [Clostridia bacterium]|nr:SDR family oxidoreductase [Clostridia bacterium]